MDDSTHFQERWGPLRASGFRFIFVFFTLIVFPFPLNVLPGISTLIEPYDSLWGWMIAWVGPNLLGLTEPITQSYSGSGDKLYDWLWYFVALGLTVIATLIWTALDWKRPNYAVLKRWFLMFLTYYLAYFMFVYGIIKLFYMQFIPLNLEQLHESYGQSSPMRLLWTFMGSSHSYTVFAGASETLAGVLLFIRKTRTLGGLVAAAVMLNVFMLNMSYDVPVKLFSFQLMLIGLYIASVDAPRILNFALNRPAPAAEHTPLLNLQPGRRILLTLQVAFIGYVVFSQVTGAREVRKQYGPDREKSPLYGVYNVETFVQNGDTLAPLFTDPMRWKRVLFDYIGFSSVLNMRDSLTRYATKFDTVEHTLTFSAFQDTVNLYLFRYQRTDSTLHLAGALAGDSIRVDLHHYDLNRFGLLNRGFHWINEVPYNRYNYE